GVVEQVWHLGRRTGLCDVYPVGAVTVGLAGQELAELGAMAESAAQVTVFSDDGHCVSDAVLMRRALEYVKAFDGVVAQHAQEPDRKSTRLNSSHVEISYAVFCLKKKKKKKSIPKKNKKKTQTRQSSSGKNKIDL